MPNPRPMSIVKVADLNSEGAISFQIEDHDRFIYFGEFANDPTRCFVFGLNDAKRIAWMHPEDFVEVSPSDF